MPRFDLQRFLGETGVSLTGLASYLRVAPTYLEAALAGQERLTRRDQDACRLLWRRLTQAVQLKLPFAEPLEAFSREHAHRAARAASKTRAPVASSTGRRRGRKDRAPA
jgi:hypothetical protein